MGPHRPYPPGVLVHAARALDAAHMLLVVLLVFFLALLVAPVVPSKSLDLGGAIFWFICTFATYAGLRLGSRPAPRRGGHAPPGASQLLATTRRTIVIGIGGVGLLFVERYVIRGAPLELDFFAVREALENSGTGALSIVSALLSAFAPFGVMLITLSRAHGAQVSTRLVFTAWTAEILYVLISLAVGSRSLLLVVAMLHMLTAAYVRRLHGRKFDGRVVLIASVVFIALALGSATMMLARLDQMGIDPMFSIQMSGYAQAVQPSPAALAWLESNGDWTPLFAALFSLCQYIFHGFFEFNLLFIDFADTHTLGAMSLWLPVKLLSFVTGIDFNVQVDVLRGWREGIFTTFLGPAFVDFWLFTPLFLLVFFWALSLPMRFLARGDVCWLPTSAMVCCIALLFPVVSLLDSASGVYPLTAAVIIPMLARKPRRRASAQPRLAIPLQGPRLEAAS